MKYVSPGMGPTNLWKFLGNSKGQPFEPFPAEAEALATIKVPWPGVKKFGKDAGVPYPRIFGVNCGRRFGKTTLMEKLIWAGMIAPDDFFGPPCVRITADTDEHARKSWDKFIWHLHNTELVNLLDSYSRERELVTFINGANAQMLSSNNPNTLAGDGVSLYLVDEAQYLTQAAWENLFPTVGERSGVIALFGVSEGDGPFREVCYKGDRTSEYPDYKRLMYPTWANPYFPKSSLELAKQEYTQVRFDQLYGAKWGDEVGKVFTGYHRIVDRKLKLTQNRAGFWQTEEFKPGHKYYGGLDVARLDDWTVVTIFDAMGTLVAFDRFNTIDWELQKARVKVVLSAFGDPVTNIDSNGIGDKVYEDWRRSMNLVDYKASSNSLKRALVDKWAVRVVQGRARLPQHPVITQEHERFEAKRAKSQGSSVILYSAPSGMHDDCVVSCALANWIMPREAQPEDRNLSLDDDLTSRQAGLWEVI